jgi:hypothetical protein
LRRPGLYRRRSMVSCRDCSRELWRRARRESPTPVRVRPSRRLARRHRPRPCGFQFRDRSQKSCGTPFSRRGHLQYCYGRSVTLRFRHRTWNRCRQLCLFEGHAGSIIRRVGCNPQTVPPRHSHSGPPTPDSDNWPPFAGGRTGESVLRHPRYRRVVCGWHRTKYMDQPGANVVSGASMPGLQSKSTAPRATATGPCKVA